MSTKPSHSHQVKQKIFVALSIVILITTGAFAARTVSRFRQPTSAYTATPRQTRVDNTFSVNRAQLDRHVVRALDVLGDRFESAARGRAILVGTLMRSVEGQQRTSQITVTRELPDKLRVEEISASGQRIFGHDGFRYWLQGEPPSAEDLSLIEVLVRDSIEHLIADQAKGAATLPLGDMFRIDDGTTANYDGPFYDIVRVEDTFRNQEGVRNRSTLYYFNSRTGLPERIVYDRANPAGRIEVEFGAWLSVGGQKLPGRTTWTENGNVIRRLVFNQALLTPIVDDGAFSPAVAP